MPRDDGKWYVVDVEVPADQGLTAAEAQAFVKELAGKVNQGQTKAQTTKPADAPPAGQAPAGTIRMYVCHNK